jgi:hypothetical protein
MVGKETQKVRSEEYRLNHAGVRVHFVLDFVLKRRSGAFQNEDERKE